LDFLSGNAEKSLVSATFFTERERAWSGKFYLELPDQLFFVFFRKEPSMAEIHVLDSQTVDKIAAGEVVERPLNVVKELVENAIDAGATAVTVEIKEGGIAFIRVTDNGSGIENSQVKKAFMRHATSKIRTAEDLTSVVSLGFRGEALSSIGAVAQVELITKTRDSLTGIRFAIEGGKEGTLEEIGAPDGTTVIVRNLFFNTPVRKKFLKQPVTEAGYIADMMEHLALCKPGVSFQYIQNGQVRFHTSGNGDLKEVIYRIYGRDIATNLVEIKSETPTMKITGFLGKPILNRANRNFETYFVNGRYIKSRTVAKAIEDGFKEYLMQHKYPFTVLHLTFEPEVVDVNVHPTKMDVRFSNAAEVYDFICSSIAATLRVREMIPEAILSEERKEKQEKVSKGPEPFEVNRQAKEMPVSSSKEITTPVWPKVEYSSGEQINKQEKSAISKRVAESMRYNVSTESNSNGDVIVNKILGNVNKDNSVNEDYKTSGIIKASDAIIVDKSVQMDLFEEKILSPDARGEYHILGQIFDTYWIVAFKDKLFFVDQHAAHEKIKYERLMKQYKERQVVSQNINPSVVISVTGREEVILKEYEEYFAELGFEIEEFGGNEYALRSVPTDLYGCNEKQLFEEVLDELTDSYGSSARNNSPTVIAEKIASMSCKAAVKGNTKMSLKEMETLIDELLTLDNPYNCPHGRPTIFSMSKYEIEKKFKRIV